MVFTYVTWGCDVVFTYVTWGVVWCVTNMASSWYLFPSVSGKTTDHIIIGTAGTVLDWILKKRAFDPKKIKLFVLDEADVMIAQQGQQDQTVRIQK